MNRALICGPLAFLFIASVIPSNAQSAEPEQSTGPGQAEDGLRQVQPPVVYYDVRGNLSLDCSGVAPGSQQPLEWSKNGTLVEEISELNQRYKFSTVNGVERAEFSIVGRTREDDFGNYTCTGASDLRTWQVHGRPHAKLAPDHSVVEGQKLTLKCKLIGKPYPNIMWRYSNVSRSDVGVQIDPNQHPRITLRPNEQQVANGELVLDAAERGDAGWYTCIGNVNEAVAATTEVRVKDMYAALWPFLGICAEVFVLCAIILVYEKRRTKPELDDSDTDNHDQKKS